MELNSKIFVAGHNGMVGSAIVKKLKLLGYHNLILKLHSELDLTNQADVSSFFAAHKPDYIFLAAAKVGGIQANNIYRANFIYDNLQIQNNIIHASFLNNAKKLLFLGSSCIYPKFASQPMCEDALLTGELEYTNEPYAVAKIAGIKMCESYNLQYGTNFISVMPTNLYGENDNFDLENSHVMPAMIRKFYLCKLLENNDYAGIAKNLNINSYANSDILSSLEKYGISIINHRVTLKLWGTGNVYREFLHVDDMAAACIFVMNKVNFIDLIQNKKEIKNTHLNIGTGYDIQIRVLAAMIANIFNFKGDVLFDSIHPDGTPKKLQDVTKLHNLGWRYEIDLDTGIKHIIRYYQQISR